MKPVSNSTTTLIHLATNDKLYDVWCVW